MTGVYEYGTIVMVDFGDTKGYEFRGKHFAITVGKKDNSNSKNITVLPLTSKNKKGKHLYIGYSVISSLISNVFEDFLNMMAFRRLIYFLDKNHKIGEIIPIYDELLNKYILSKNKLLIKVNSELINNWIDEDYKKYREIMEWYKKYNKQSYVRLDSIRSIDKRRILDKVNSLDPINSTVLPIEYQNKIKKELNKEYC